MVLPPIDITLSPPSSSPSVFTSFPLRILTSLLTPLYSPPFLPPLFISLLTTPLHLPPHHVPHLPLFTSLSSPHSLSSPSSSPPPSSPPASPSLSLTLLPTPPQPPSSPQPPPLLSLPPVHFSVSSLRLVISYSQVSQLFISHSQVLQPQAHPPLTSLSPPLSPISPAAHLPFYLLLLFCFLSSSASSSCHLLWSVPPDPLLSGVTSPFLTLRPIS
jgi:hypothetical protein